MRIYTVNRTAGHILHAPLTAVLRGAPAIAAVELRVVVADRTVAILELERAILDHLGVEAAVRCIIDVLEEKAYHAL